MRDEVHDRYGNTIYLTDERWNHIVKTHPIYCNGLPSLIGEIMFLSYDPEGDVLEVVFDENLHHAEQVAYKLRQGMILYVTADKLKPVQLTLGNYRTLMQFPHVKFEGWKKLSTSDKKFLKPILAAPTVSAFLRLDPETGYGHLVGPGMPEILSVAA